MEKIVEQMQQEETGVPVRTVKSFMTKIPSVFTGADLILWMMRNLDVEDQSECGREGVDEWLREWIRGWVGG